MARKKRDKKRKRVSARRRVEEHKTGFQMTSLKMPDGVGMFKVKSTDVLRLEVIPYIVPSGAGNPFADDGSETYERTYFTHRDIGADGDVYVCPAKTAKKKCPICEQRVEMMRNNEDEDQIKALIPKERQLFNIYDHAAPDKGVQVWDVSHFLFGKQVEDYVKDGDEDDDYDYFADREDGFTVKVGMEKKAVKGNPFYSTTTVEFKQRKKPIPDEIFEAAIALDELLIVLPYEELKAIYYQTQSTDSSADDDDVDDDDQDEVEAPPKTEKKKRKKKEKKKEAPTAESCGLVRGDNVEYDDEEYSIFKISKDGTSLTLIDDNDDMVKAISPGEVTVIKDDPSENVDDDLPDEDEDDFDDDDDDEIDGSWIED